MDQSGFNTKTKEENIVNLYQNFTLNDGPSPWTNCRARCFQILESKFNNVYIYINVLTYFFIKNASLDKKV